MRSRVHAAAPDDREFDLNEAMTALNAAVEREDYAEAARLKKLIGDAAPSARKSWDDAVPEWLHDRLERLAYRFPTPVQAATLRAARSGRDVVVRAPTGSGKTLAYLTLCLSLIAPELEQRGRETLGSVVERPDLTPTEAFMWLAPALSTMGSSQGQSQDADASAKPPLPPRGLPLAVVIVPRPMLAEQVAGVAYALVGGYARAARSWQPGARDSLFRFQGPKGSRVLLATSDRLPGVAADSALSTPEAEKSEVAGASPAGETKRPPSTDVELAAAELRNCDMLVATPEALQWLAARGLIDAAALAAVRCLAVDEGDEADVLGARMQR
jgi:hypothetical protein